MGWQFNCSQEYRTLMCFLTGALYHSWSPCTGNDSPSAINHEHTQWHMDCISPYTGCFYHTGEREGAGWSAFCFLLFWSVLAQWTSCVWMHLLMKQDWMIPTAIVRGLATGKETWNVKGKPCDYILTLTESKFSKQKEECEGVEGKMIISAGSRYISGFSQSVHSHWSKYSYHWLSTK